VKKKTARRKFAFKNHAVTLKVRKIGARFVYGEWNSFSRCLLWCDSDSRSGGPKFFKTYEAAVKAMQRYSKRYYGEVAK